jgi:hypothetical protein
MKSSKDVFKMAWMMAYVAVKKFGGNVKDYIVESIKLAWQQIKQGFKKSKDMVKSDYVALLINHVIAVSFFKKDGSKRLIYGTLNFDYINQHQHQHQHQHHDSNSSKTRTVPEHQIIIFDAEINEYRSFIIDNVIDYVIIA